MHYTSIENIHKLIDPLFLDGLKAEFAEIAAVTVERTCLFFAPKCLSHKGWIAHDII